VLGKQRNAFDGLRW